MDAHSTLAPAVVETPMFFENGSYRLFGILHQPVGPPSGTAWVFCHPFAEEKLWAQRVYVSFARILAARGAWVLRFDAMGNGDSEGQFSESSAETMLSDIGCAISVIKRSSQMSLEVGLLGLRFGATLAALAAERYPNVGKLVLWEPIVDGEKYMQELLRVNLTTQMAVYKEIRHKREDLVRLMQNGDTVNVDGYAIAYPCYEQASAVKLHEGRNQFTSPCLIVQVGREGQTIRPELKALHEAYPSADIRLAVEDQFWKEIKRWYRTAPNLFEVTVTWMGDR
jgi:exosortase A-associated hydrolase 2